MEMNNNETKPLKTIKDLKEAIKGETTAWLKYAAYAKKAKEEGLNTIAKLFEAASKAEEIHAVNHTKALQSLGEKMENFKVDFEVKTTAENLQDAIDGETYEATIMYPQFVGDAKEEKVEKAERSFTWAWDTEKKHQQFYSDALKALQKNNIDSLPSGYAVCPVCGNTFDQANVDEKCAFCKTSKEKYLIF
jgi:rubrerythrin